MTHNNSQSNIDSIITNYKDELVLLESQHKARMEQGVKHINLEEYRIRIRMIRIFQEELETIKHEFKIKNEQIEVANRQRDRYKEVINNNPIEVKTAMNDTYLRCCKCKKEAINNSSYCRVHLKEQIAEAQDLLKQFEV